MATSPATSTTVTVRDPRTGRYLTVHGVGALEGRLFIAEGIDLTKPIAAQVMARPAKREAAAPQTR